MNFLIESQKPALTCIRNVMASPLGLAPLNGPGLRKLSLLLWRTGARMGKLLYSKLSALDTAECWEI